MWNIEMIKNIAFFVSILTYTYSYLEIRKTNNKRFIRAHMALYITIVLMIFGW